MHYKSPDTQVKCLYGKHFHGRSNGKLNAYDPYSAPFALKQMRTPLYSSFWKPLKSFNIRPKSFERVNRVIIQPENLVEYIQLATTFEKELQKSNPGFVMGIFQPLGGGSENVYFNTWLED